MTIAEWIGTALLLSAPYLAIGVLWTLLDTAHLAGTEGLQKLGALVGGIAFWPVLLLAQVCGP